MYTHLYRYINEYLYKQVANQKYVYKHAYIRLKTPKFLFWENPSRRPAVVLGCWLQNSP